MSIVIASIGLYILGLAVRVGVRVSRPVRVGVRVGVRVRVMVMVRVRPLVRKRATGSDARTLRALDLLSRNARLIQISITIIMTRYGARLSHCTFRTPTNAIY